MCGIAGIINLVSGREIAGESLERMISVVRHRGPDGFGFYRDSRAGLAHARLSIIDLEGGKQPLSNEDGTVWITFNGEIFNYLELRQMLVDKGHRFATVSDTEVIVHLYEELGTECLRYLNGQFAFALWDKRSETLFLARDRMGIRPLFYTSTDKVLLFASEIKSLFTDPRIAREMDPAGLDQIFTFWMTVPPRTAFRNVHELPAGHFLQIRNGELDIRQYWDPEIIPDPGDRSEEECAEELRDLLVDAMRLQLRADVPVGAYLSGGVDSSAITSLIKHYSDTPLRTFSVAFPGEGYDESRHQHLMTGFLRAQHSVIPCTSDDIGKVFSEVIWHTEKPIIRTAPAPMYLLAKLVRESGFKVVLTGEGADEILAGYDIFKEVKTRAFIARCPGSARRSLILKRLYPYLSYSPVQSQQYAQAFFSSGSDRYPASCSSHAPRWTMTSMIKAFYSADLREQVLERDNREMLVALFDNGPCRDALSQAQYIEMKMLLSGYLLSSQGDRMAMAHSVEGRFPFLDHRVVEFCGKLPLRMKMKVLNEKYILKKSMKGIVPDPILERTKQPYMAPDAKSLLGDHAPPYLEELLSEQRIREDGYFDPTMVAALVKKCRARPMLGFKDNMALVGIVSTQLTHAHFIRDFNKRTGALAEPLREGAYHAAQS